MVLVTGPSRRADKERATTMAFLALCEIQWVIKFHFPTEKVNRVDKVVDIAVAPGASFG